MEGGEMMVHAHFHDDSKMWIHIEKISTDYDNKMQYFLNSFRGTNMVSPQFSYLTVDQKVTAKNARASWNAHVEMEKLYGNKQQQQEEEKEESVDVVGDDTPPVIIPLVVAANVSDKMPWKVEHSEEVRPPAKRVKVDEPTPVTPPASTKTPSPKPSIKLVVPKPDIKIVATNPRVRTPTAAAPVHASPAAAAAPVKTSPAAAAAPVKQLSVEDRVKAHMKAMHSDDQEVNEMLSHFLSTMPGKK
eukprot:jgi/Mesvir1/26769/Mv20545-RA.1